MKCTFTTCVLKIVLVVVGTVGISVTADGTVFYHQDFESITPGQASPTAWGLNDGGLNIDINRPGLWEVTAHGGANGTKGMVVSFDGYNSFYSIDFGRYGNLDIIASDANPLDNGAVVDPSQIRFSIDLKTVGNVTVTPVRLNVLQNDRNYEADHHIDANLDGDMNDGALIYSSSFFPVLTSGADYQTASFTLDQGNIDAYALRFSPGPIKIPLTPRFDPTVSLSWSVYFNYTGFGYDAGNVVYVDNIEITSVPEPTTLALFSLAAVMLGVSRLRHR